MCFFHLPFFEEVLIMCGSGSGDSLFDPHLLTFRERNKGKEIPKGLQFSLRLKSVIHRQTSHWRFVLTATNFGADDLLNQISIEFTLDGPDFRTHPVTAPFRFNTAEKAPAFLMPELEITAQLREEQNDRLPTFTLEVFCSGVLAGTPVEARHKVPSFVNPAAFALESDPVDVTAGCKPERRCREKPGNQGVSSCQVQNCISYPDGSKLLLPWVEEPGTDGCPTC
jgi:hypothetical protein